jgi:predicted phosphodiesterase
MRNLLRTPDEVILKVLQLRQEGKTYREIRAEVNIGESTVQEIVTGRLKPLSEQAPSSQNVNPFPESTSSPRLPEPCPEGGGPSLPDSWAEDPRLGGSIFKPVQINTPGRWGVLGDVHAPMHDKETLEAFAKRGKERNYVGILINGDFLDMMGVSPFFRIATRARLIDEINVGVDILRWLRAQFPRQLIIFRDGNHEFRLQRYLYDNAPALQDFPSLQLDALLQFESFGIQWVTDGNLVKLGKLNTLHGHELRKGQGINPARFAFMQTYSNVLVGHWHITSKHSEKTLDGKVVTCWSHGCSCYTRPRYARFGKWTLGFAEIEVFNDGAFSVRIEDVIEGRVV